MVCKFHIFSLVKFNRHLTEYIQNLFSIERRHNKRVVGQAWPFAHEFESPVCTHPSARLGRLQSHDGPHGEDRRRAHHQLDVRAQEGDHESRAQRVQHEVLRRQQGGRHVPSHAAGQAQAANLHQTVQYDQDELGRVHNKWPSNKNAQILEDQRKRRNTCNFFLN